MIFSTSFYVLEHLVAGCSAGSMPHGDAAGQDAFDGAPVKGAHDWGRDSDSFQFPKEIKVLLSLSGQ